MHVKSKVLPVVAVCLSLSAAARGAVIYADRAVSCQGDGTNKSAQPLPVKNADSPNSPTYDRKIWMGFGLAAVAADFDSASVTVTQTDPAGGGDGPPADDWEFGLYGLTDDSLDGWAVGDFQYDDAPGNLSGSGQGGSLDANLTTLLGTFTVTGGGSAGVTETVASAALVDFLNDTRADGNATLILIRHTQAGDNIVHGFAPAGEPAGPSLTYTLVPEPVTLLLVLPAAVLLSRRRR